MLKLLVAFTDCYASAVDAAAELCATLVGRATEQMRATRTRADRAPAEQSDAVEAELVQVVID